MGSNAGAFAATLPPQRTLEDVKTVATPVDGVAERWRQRRIGGYVLERLEVRTATRKAVAFLVHPGKPLDDWHADTAASWGLETRAYI
jgi:hypothetical protein